MTIEYETAEVTLKMSAPEFEAVYEILGSYVAMMNATAAQGRPEYCSEERWARDLDNAATVQHLRFTFSNGRWAQLDCDDADCDCDDDGFNRN